MKLYTTPQPGTYYYKTPNFDGTFRCQQVKVVAMGESEKTYLIRLCYPMGNHKQNDQIRVRKHNVRLHGMTSPTASRTEYDYSEAWWNN